MSNFFRISPYYHAFRRVPWQFCLSLTFEEPVPSERVRLSMFRSLMRKFARKTHLHFDRLIWLLREENGDLDGRAHFHAVACGVSFRWLGQSTVRWLETEWKRTRGGTAKVEIYDPSIPFDFLQYALKISWRDANSFEGRESAKFGPNDCKLIRSPGLDKLLGIET
jgi:hypothetical protein